MRLARSAIIAAIWLVSGGAPATAQTPPRSRQEIRAGVRECRTQQRACRRACKKERGTARGQCRRSCLADSRKCVSQARGRPARVRKRASGYARLAHCRVTARRCTIGCMKNTQRGPERVKCLEGCRATHDRCKSDASPTPAK